MSTRLPRLSTPRVPLPSLSTFCRCQARSPLIAARLGLSEFCDREVVR
jgi:hypothetical protein